MQKHFKHFKEILLKFLDRILIKPTDSDPVKAKKIIWYSFFGSIFGLFVISWIIFIIFTFTTDNVKIPMIEGDNIYIALNKLYERHLIANVFPKFSDSVEADKVYDQTPSKGSIVKRGRTVTFHVSLGPKSASLPDFRGYTLFELDEYLNNKYLAEKIPFEIDKPVYEFNTTVEKGRIIKQEPKDGTPIHNVKKIKFWISNGIKEENLLKIKNYIGKKVEDVSGEITNLEILYTYDFVPVNNKQLDMTIIDQSIPEGRIVDEIIEEGKILTLKINKYEYIDNDKIKSTYLLDIPKKPLPYQVEVKIKTGMSKEKSIFKKMTKGGVSVPIPYTGKKDSKLTIYYEGKLVKEVLLNEEIAKEN